MEALVDVTLDTVEARWPTVSMQLIIVGSIVTLTGLFLWQL